HAAAVTQDGHPARVPRTADPVRPGPHDDEFVVQHRLAGREHALEDGDRAFRYGRDHVGDGAADEGFRRNPVYRRETVVDAHEPHFTVEHAQAHGRRVVEGT